MKKIALLLCLLSSCAFGQPMDAKGSSLFEACHIAIDNLGQGDKIISSHDLFEGAVCLSYVEGFIDARVDATDGLICTGNHSPEVIIRLYVKFMQDNPLYLDAHRSDGFKASLLVNFPCQPEPSASPHKP